ncbi:metal-response element-binding transcription factor 2-like [Diadema antillarum]|uniref:metal-response element-binding transcription factor 2-like n=1 Tax=Diadema antillarum TaxID=105358 RepID=UPI003A8838D8
MAASTQLGSDLASCSSQLTPKPPKPPPSQSEEPESPLKTKASPKRPMREVVSAKLNNSISAKSPGRQGNSPKRPRKEGTGRVDESTANKECETPKSEKKEAAAATEAVTDECEAAKGRQYSEGLDVLARWSDGLFYLGTVTKVDADHEKCMVSFEDNSEFWVLYKDLQKALTDSEDITCFVCHDGTSELPNEIVICDRCGRGYHQQCHSPAIEGGILQNEDEPWHCRPCVFVSSVKVGGALKKGPAAKAFQEVKKALPYKIENLHWDSGHKTNTEQCYCYCGGPGDWYLKMLQCCRCRQWFHEACVQCIEIPMMYGDRFYIFVCSVCNRGPEYLKRLPLKWVDLAQLVLYNLTLLHKKKYYDFEDEILPNLTQEWNNYQVPHLSETTRSEKQESMLSALLSSKMRFACGKEVKKKKNLWGLRVRTPPVPPTIVLPAIGQITDEVMNDMKMKGRKVVTFFPVQSLSPVPLERRRKQKGLTAEEIAAKSKKARKLLLEATNNKLPHPLTSPNQLYRGYAGGVCSSSIITSGGCSVLDMIPPLEMVPLGNSVVPCSPSVPEEGMSSKNGAGQDNGAVNQYGRLLSRQLEGKKRRGRKRKHRPSEDADDLSSSEVSQAPDIHKPWPEKPPQGTSPSKLRLNGMSETANSLSILQKSVSSYFGAEGRLACGEGYKVLGKRICVDGKVQYLIQWEGCSP